MPQHSQQSRPSLDESLELVPEADYAKFRGMSLRTAKNKRARGECPEYVKDGNMVKYPLAAIQEYLAARTVKPTRHPTMTEAKPRRGRPTRRSTAV